jgi:hypothetical protein
MQAVPTALLAALTALIYQGWNLLPGVKNGHRFNHATLAYAPATALLVILLWQPGFWVECSGVMVMFFGDGVPGPMGWAVPSLICSLWGREK